tara:strand:+ start:363 stop:677 length:315 start_codon:yes stop_codon:yes gene_type:complete
MQGYDEEAADQIKCKLELLHGYKLAVEYYYHRDKYSSDKLKFAIATEKAWKTMTQNQKDVVYMHTIQGFSFAAIADLQGKDPSTISRTFSAACKKTTKKINEEG